MTSQDRTQSHAFVDWRFARAIFFWDAGQSVVELVPGARLRVGRGEDCDVKIDHRSVSRAHLELLVSDDDEAVVSLRDVGSSNGVRLDGRLLTRGQEARLGPGMVVEFGQARLVVSRGSRTRETEGGMEAVRKMIELVAPTALAVLVVGETGVGKELVAEAVHRASGRKGPLVRVNCAALTEGVLESELFGHERGAFTGAVASHAGVVEQSRDGTLFLDEIGELSAATQAKLLRVIEQREVRRVGGSGAIAVDVRFVAATHRDLDALCEAGGFRRDLFFRLNGITIAIPPLRERRSEIVPLALELLRRSSRPRAVLTPAAAAMLERHSWPGNVRELRNVIERAAVLARDAIGPEHVQLRTPKEAPAPESTDERERIREALEKSGGNQGRAAEMLGISRRTLVSRLSKYGFPRPRQR